VTAQYFTPKTINNRIAAIADYWAAAAVVAVVAAASAVAPASPA
jgi:hypothetical protein